MPQHFSSPLSTSSSSDEKDDGKMGEDGDGSSSFQSPREEITLKETLQKSGEEQIKVGARCVVCMTRNSVLCRLLIWLTLSLPRVSLNRNMPHRVWRTWPFIAYPDEGWLYYQFSTLHLYASLEDWEKVLFELGSEGVKRATSIIRFRVTGQNAPPEGQSFHCARLL